LSSPPALETWAIVVAAGSGERLGADRPKAFVQLGDRPLVAASLGVLDDHDGIDGIVVAVPEGWEDRMSLLADDIAASKIAAAVAGGPSRGASVALALEAVPDSADFVLVHDAARPLLTAGLIDRVMAGLAEGYDGVVPALPVTDTVKRVDHRGLVIETLDRTTLRAVQTPQGFPAATLRRAIEAAGDRLGSATDCAMLVESTGGRVVCVDGESDNLKITTGDDLRVAGERYAG
jgi:2-C-methyl-D-erythritol 4-phosphate cytidylyltransferase